MSNDSGLTDKERAILAGLAEQAAADDPVLAAALRGGRRLDRLRLPELPTFVHHWAFGMLCAVAGLVLAVLGLSTSMIFGVGGVLIMFLGVGIAVTAWSHHSPAEPSDQAADPDVAP